VKTTLTSLPVEEIIADPEVQPRERLSDAIIMEYAEAMLAGDEFPPIRVFEDRWSGGRQGGRRLWLGDGFLRLAAATAIGEERIEAELGPGSKRAAILWACTANIRHGFRPTRRDKRRAVLKLLSDEEWGQWADREIARHTGTSPGLVATMRAELGICSNTQIDGEPETRRVRRGDQEYEMRMPLRKDRERHEPERWAMVYLYDDVDNLYNHVVSTGIDPITLLEHLNPEREARLRSRAAACQVWLEELVLLLAGQREAGVAP
jgi:hypothetical protein